MPAGGRGKQGEELGAVEAVGPQGGPQFPFQGEIQRGLERLIVAALDFQSLFQADFAWCATLNPVCPTTFPRNSLR